MNFLDFLESDNPYKEEWSSRHRQELLKYVQLHNKCSAKLIEALKTKNVANCFEDEDEVELQKWTKKLSDCLDKEYEDWLLSAKIASSLSEEQGKYILKFVMSKTEATDIKQKCVLAKLDEIQELLDGLAENTES